MSKIDKLFDELEQTLDRQILEGCRFALDGVEELLDEECDDRLARYIMQRTWEISTKALGVIADRRYH